MSNVFLFKTKHAAYNSARSKEGEPITIHLKAYKTTASAGDIAVIYTAEKQGTPPSPKVCFVISSRMEGDPACYSVVIEKVDPLKKASHLVRYPGGFAEWTNLKGENTKVIYLNGAEISPVILGSTQIEGVAVKIIRAKYTMQLSSNNCFLLREGELDFGDDLKSFQVVKELDMKDHIAQVQKLIKERTGSDLAVNEFPTNDGEATNTGDESDNAASPKHDNSNGQTKREAEDNGVEKQSSKKIRSSPDASAPVDPPSPAPPSPTKLPPNIDLIKHIAEVAQMVKEMDDEHSDRLSKVEMEVIRIRSILQQHSLITSHLSMSSPSLTTPSSNASAKRRSKNAKGSQKRPSFSLSDIHAGELVAVRADRTVTPDAYYWIARVMSVGKSLVRVKWFEPCEFASSWFLFDNKEDEIEVGTIFAKNFELTLKPVKHPSGHYVDIYKPVNDLGKFDAYK
jgi:hypothetical protein